MLSAIRDINSWKDIKVRCLLQDLKYSDDQPIKVNCPECQGRGYITDYGEATGEEFEAACPECDGKEQVKADSLTPEQMRKSLSAEQYFSELETDLKALAVWTRQPPEVVLTQAGFRCWTNIEYRKLCCQVDHPSSFY